jgi:tetratricopeptide (TPR) repeat protein
MSTPPASQPRTLTPSQVCRVEQLCEAFEALLKAAARTGQWPALEEHLAQAAEPERAALLRELLGLEVDYRRRAGEAPTPELYLQRFPEHVELVQTLFQDPGPGASPSQAATEIVAGGGARTTPRRGPEPPAIPGYECLEEIGRGGMGVVYRAWQARPGRLVALKTILPSSGLAGDESAARFVTEAEAVGRLNHPHIVHIYEMGECEGRLYFSMEYVAGGNLGQKLGTPWPPREAAALAATLAAAVHAVHQQGIIHRDLKPANVLLTPDGTPKVTDFGLAKFLVGARGDTVTGMLLGTPAYMAPEQARGKAREVTQAADVWALGAILYALLAGRAPFLGESHHEIMTRVIHEDVVAPSRLRDGVPPDLETICLKCLEKEPKRRYVSAAQLAERLRLFLDGKPIPDRPPGRWERLVRAARRRPVLASLMGAGAAAVLGLLLLSLWWNAKLNQEVREAVARTAVQDRLLRGQKAIAERRWDEATALLDGAWGEVQGDAALADLQGEVGRLRDEARRRATAHRAREAALARYKDWRRFHRDTMSRVYGLGGEEAGGMPPAWLRERMHEAAGRAGELNENANLPASEKQDVAAGSQELLLTLADRFMPAGAALPAEAAAAVRVLERAAGLGAPCRTYHERLAGYLGRVGRADEAARARRRAAAMAASGATDHFLQGLERLAKPSRDGLENATGHFTAALRESPRHFWALYCLARCHLLLERWADALNAFSGCVQQEPDFPAALLGRGFTYGKLRQFKVADSDFREVEKQRPSEEDRYRLYLLRGTVRADAGQLADARKDFEAALALRPGSVAALTNLGHIHRQRNEWQAAARRFQEVIDLKPAAVVVAGARAEIGRVWAMQAQAAAGAVRAALCRKAVESCDLALKLDSSQLMAHRVRAEALLDVKDYREALESYNAYLNREWRPGEPLEDAYRGHAQVRAQLADYRGAIDDYTRALDRRPARDPDVLVHRGWARYLADAWRLALADFEEAIRLTETQEATRLVGALAPGGAAASPWAALAVSARRSGDAHNGRGNCLVLLDDDKGAAVPNYRRAVADAETAERLVPRSAEMTHNLACIFAQVVGKVKLDRTERAVDARTREYTRRAVRLLRQALAMLTPAERTAFWRQKMRPDPTLKPIHDSPEFKRLEQDMGPARLAPRDPPFFMSGLRRGWRYT